MNLRYGTVGLFALTLALGGCAAGGGAGGGGIAATPPQDIDDSDLPAWVLALPEGEAPRDTDNTAQTALQLIQAANANDANRVSAYQTALESARAGIALDATNAQSYYQAGEALLALGQYEEANEMFEQAEEIYPRYVLQLDFLRLQEWIGQFNEGVDALANNDEPAALAAFERAHLVYQDRPEAMFQLAAMYDDLGRTEEALALSEQAIALAENPPPQYLEDVELVDSWQGPLEIAKYNIGHMLFAAERFDEAADSYQAVVDADPEDLTAVSNLGAALVAAGRADEAAAIYDDLLSRPNLGATEYNTIAVGLYNLGQLVPAAEAFGRAAELIPQAREFHYNRAQALYQHVQDNPEDPELPQILQRLVDVTDPLIELDTHTSNSHRLRAQGLVDLDRQDDALAILEPMSEWPFEVRGMQLAPVAGGYAVAGEVVNNDQAAGSTVNLRIHFFNQSGAEAGTQDVAVSLGDVDTAAGFQADLGTEDLILGYYYEVL